jgi:hypothetical protein
MAEARAGGGQDFGRPVGREDFNQQFKQPVILQFQPDRFHIAETPEQLKNWESVLQKRVGLPASVAETLARRAGENGGTCCESGSTDDCDVD